MWIFGLAVLVVSVAGSIIRTARIMVSIRRKVEPEPSAPRYLLTAPGLGLRFVLPEVVARGSAS